MALSPCTPSPTAWTWWGSRGQQMQLASPVGTPCLLSPSSRTGEQQLERSGMQAATSLLLSSFF